MGNEIVAGKIGVFQCIMGRGHGKMSITVIPSNFLGVHEILGVEVRDFGRDFAGNIGAVKTSDSGNSGFPVLQ